MPSYVKLATESGDKYLTALSEFQDNFLKSVATSVEHFKAAASAAKTPPVPDLQIPTAQEIAEANFAFVQKLVKQQKGFVEKLLATSTPAAR